jgi:hypothetical protein
LWCVGDLNGFQLEPAGFVDEVDVVSRFGGGAALYHSPASAAVIADREGTEDGYWTDDTLLRAVVEAAIERLVSP